ncbi:MAG: GWxTD domain-containing protein [Saprospiraceae bacterium]|nr:GWxTD domain-containing protein [Saprospiraceae bacterium]
MKKWIFLLLTSCYMQAVSALDVSISYATFKGIDKPYIEVYLHVAGKTATYHPVSDSASQATMEVLILFKRGEEIVKFDKYLLNSPVHQYPLDFVDMKRYALDNGEYELTVNLQDTRKPENTKAYQAPVVIQYGNDGLQQSDLQLLASYRKDESGTSPFAKSGIHMEPLPYHFYGKNASLLLFYNELYNSLSAVGDDFQVSYFIEQKVEGQPKTVMIGHKRLKPAPVVPLLIQMDISTLESGNYTLVVEARDRLKTLLSRKSLFFQRSNPYLNPTPEDLTEQTLAEEFVSRLSQEDLEFSVRAIMPKIPQQDMETVGLMLKQDSLNALRMYLFSYWIKKSATNPEGAYLKYMQVAHAVDQQFRSGFRHGIETDRGFTYLKYGQPDDIEGREDEPSAPPYEIWIYYDFPFTKQKNVKFLFYNPSLAPGEFRLLHSTANGELNNPQWELELYRDAPDQVDGDAFDSTSMKDNFNRSAKRIMSDY